MPDEHHPCSWVKWGTCDGGGSRSVPDEHHPCSCPMELGGGGAWLFWVGGESGYSIGPDQGRRTLRHRSGWALQVGGVGREKREERRGKREEGVLWLFVEGVN